MRYWISTLLLIITTLSLTAQETSTHNISQTQDGVTITLDQSYADGKQIAVWFTIDGLDLPDDRLMGAPIFQVMPILADYSPSAIGAISGEVDFDDDGSISGFFTYELEVDVQDTLELSFDVTLAQTEGMPLFLVPDGVPMEESANPEYAYELPYDIQVSFPLILDVTPAQTILTDFSDTSNDLTLSIDAITITPLFAEVPVCFDVPDGRDWQPVITLEVNGEVVQPSGFSLVDGVSEDATQRCTDFDFRLDGVETIEDITITIDGYQASIPDVIDDERIARAQERLAELGIVANFDIGTRGNNIYAVTYPDTFTEAEANRIVYNALRDRYEASWEFALEMSE